LRYLSPPEHADLTLKEKALARTTPLHAKPGRYQVRAERAAAQRPAASVASGDQAKGGLARLASLCAGD